MLVAELAAGAVVAAGASGGDEPAAWTNPALENSTDDATSSLILGKFIMIDGYVVCALTECLLRQTKTTGCDHSIVC